MIELRALGNAEIETGVTTLTPSQEVVFAAALYLVLERGKRVSRARLASLLWPRVAPKPRAHRLRQTILQLKKLGIVVRADRDSLQISQHDARSDVDALSVDDPRVPSGLHSLEFLPGYTPRSSEPLRDWVDAKRDEVHALVTRGLVRDLERARLQGDWASVDKLSSQCLSLDSFNEAAVLAQAEASAMRGGKRKAISILDRYIAEIGDGQSDLRLPATLLRRRVVERVPDRPALLNVDPPFVGREVEMEALTRSFGRARTGHGSATLLIGEPGIGKSRLTAELGRFAELQGANVQRATCRRSDLDRPLSLFVDIVPQLRDMPGALGCEPDTFAWLKRLTEFEHRSGESSRPVDSEMLFQNIRAALFDLLDSVAEERCLVILIEDVQWLDAASANILARVIEWCEAKRLFLLLNSRPVSDSALGHTEKARLDQIVLSPLTAVASTALLQSIALRPGDEPEKEFVDWCLTVAEGNPFFLQELVHQWIETGHRYEAPPSVTKVLQERLSRLSREALQVLQTSAVLGDHATLDRVERVLEYHPHQLLSAVEELSKAAMLGVQGESADAAAGQLQPRHDLVSAGALSRLSPLSLAFVHRRSADVLEREIAQEAMSTAMMWACANHRHQAGDRERALSLSLSCAQHLMDVGLARDSAIAFQQSLDYCITDAQRLAVLPRLAFAFQMNAEWRRSKDVLQTCIQLSTKVNPEQSAHNDFELMLLEAKHQSSFEYSTLLRDVMPCVECVDASPAHRVRAAIMALKIATDTGPTTIVDSLYSHVAPLLTDNAVPERSRLEVEIIYLTLRGKEIIPLEQLRRFVNSADRTDGLGYLNALLTAASSCRISGRYTDGLAFISEALDHVASHKLTNRIAQALLGAVRIHVAAGAFDKADAVLRDVQNHPTTSDDPHSQSEPLFLEARIAIEKGDLARAYAAFSRIPNVPPTYSASRRAYFFALAVHIHLMQGAARDLLEPSVASLHQAHALVQGTGVKDFESYALFLGLRALGQEGRGIRMLRDYVGRYRRSRWPIAERVQVVLRANDSPTDRVVGTPISIGG